MPDVTRILSLDDPRVAPFARLTGAQLRSRLDPASALIVVESPKVIATALDAGLEPVALLAEERHLRGDALPILQRCPDMEVYTGPRELLAGLTGYSLTRGVLCAMRRPPAPALESLLSGARRVAVIDAVSDTTNIGSIFRSAAALDIDAVLLTPTACDPYNRRSIRVSMGSVFLVPWTWMPDIGLLHSLGWQTVAMALTPRSTGIDDPRLVAAPRLAIVLGTEGDGLDPEVIRACTYTARIPMAHGVDSLNVGAAAAVAFWQLRAR